MVTTLTRAPYGGWENCYTLSNGAIALTVTSDVGPRVIRWGFAGGDNLFYEHAETMGVTSGEAWNIFGGHRLWHAPESNPRTYAPDNSPVTVEAIPDGMRVTQPTEPTTGIAKAIDLVMHPDSPHVRVTHTLINRSVWDVTLAPWSLSVMAIGGTAVIPLPARGSHEGALVDGSTIRVWSYTHMNDPRWTWGSKYILLRSEVGGVPQKIGASVTEGWAAYTSPHGLFVKYFDYQPGAVYPDDGSNCELFTNHFMLEVESLGQLTTLKPGGMVSHVEDWVLFPAVASPTRDVEVETQIMPHVHQGRALTGR